MKYLKKITLSILVIIVILITFYSQYVSLIKDIESTAKSKEAQINRYIDLSKGFIDLITIYGDDFFKSGAGRDSELYSLLKYDPGHNNYNLDAVGGTKYQKATGNLTGLGSIPKSGIYRDEINLALQLNQQFSSVYNKLPETAWIYYTSKNDFISIYPWVSSEDFEYKKDLKDENFFSYVTPQNDPLRESVWTPVYLDHAGKGLMVTLSNPIYQNDTFMGAVSIDITNKQLSEMISSKYEIYIIDDTNSVIANSLNIESDDKIAKFDTILNSSQSDIGKIEKIKNNTIQRAGKYYIYSVNFNNATWRMFFRVSVWSIVGRAMLFTLPILVICLLLLFAFFEVEKRRKAEIMLKHSLEELTSYQNLLENAAKYDFLTSTVNRRGLMSIFNKCIDVNNISNTPISFIMGDIDYFKKFNDTFGHAAGDKVLMAIAKIMQESIKTDDVVCRWGGEEFVIMLLGRTYDEAIVIAENIRKEIESAVIPWENSTQLRTTMTFGVVEYLDHDSIENSISKADNALYMAKEKGRNRVTGYLELLNKVN